MCKRNLFFLALISIFIFHSCGLLDTDPDNNPIPTKLNCDIDSDMVLTNRNTSGVDYIVDCTVALTAVLTIEEGTIIEFARDAGLEVKNGGSIRAIGIGGAPVVMRGEGNGSDTWRGIYIQSESTTSTFEFVEIVDAGEGASFTLFSNDHAAITLDGSMRMTNSKIVNSGGHGVWVASELFASNIIEFEDNIIEECTGFPMMIELGSLDNMDLKSCTFKENGENMIGFTEKEGSWVENELTMKALDVPYFFGFDMMVRENLTIEAGTEIIMGAGTFIGTENSTQRMTIQGTATNRVSISGKDSEAGYWKGILVQSESNNIFENLDISDGGSSAAGFNEQLGNITLEFGGKLTMIDCTSSRTNSACDVVLSSFGGIVEFIDMSSDLKICEE